MTKPTKFLINPNDPEQVEWLKAKLGVTEPVSGNQQPPFPFPGPALRAQLAAQQPFEVPYPPTWFRRLFFSAAVLVVFAVDGLVWFLLRPSGVLRTIEGWVLGILVVLALLLIWRAYRMGQP
jgi:hypothetical protein